MLSFLVVLQILVAVFLILVVLLQPGNKGGVGAALGGAGGETVFGGRGANTFLAKLTLGAAILFMATNFTLSFLSSPKSSAVNQLLQQQEAAQKKTDVPPTEKAAAAPASANSAAQQPEGAPSNPSPAAKASEQP